MLSISKKLVAILFTLWIVLTVSFLWKESFDISYQINDQKITNYFFIIGAVGTTFSLFMLYMQIVETRKTRLATSFPDIYFELTNFYIEVSQELNFNNADNLPVAYPKTMTRDGNISAFNTVTVYNIGVGAAKNIVADWEFDEDKLKQLIKGKYYGEDFTNESNCIDFIPANNTSAVTLPYLYFQCCGPDLNDNEINLVFEEKTHKPALSINVSYNDIYNNKYQKKFKVTVNAYSNFATFKFNETPMKEIK